MGRAQSEKVRSVDRKYDNFGARSTRLEELTAYIGSSGRNHVGYASNRMTGEVRT